MWGYDVIQVKDAIQVFLFTYVGEERDKRQQREKANERNEKRY